MNVAVSDNNYKRSRVHAHMFALWVAIASMVMMFVALTSAYIVRHAAGNWLEFRLPDVFMYSTLMIIVSSAALQGSYHAFNKEKEGTYKVLLALTFVLGLSFLVLQYQGWMALYDIGIELTGNPSGSFIYVISGIHATHLLGGLAALTVALVHAFSLPFKVTKIRKQRLALSLTFWHFLGILWIFLYFFFLFQQS